MTNQEMLEKKIRELLNSKSLGELVSSPETPGYFSGTGTINKDNIPEDIKQLMKLENYEDLQIHMDSDIVYGDRRTNNDGPRVTVTARTKETGFDEDKGPYDYYLTNVIFRAPAEQIRGVALELKRREEELGESQYRKTKESPGVSIYGRRYGFVPVDEYPEQEPQRPHTRIVLAPNYEAAEAYRRDHHVTATVEAEYGSRIVEGEKYTLAHHDTRSDNNSPCVGSKGATKENVLKDGDVILISHIDLDTIGGIMQIEGIKPQNDTFWLGAAYIDVNGPHKEHDLPETVVDRLHGYDVWAESQPRTRYEEVTDVTDIVRAYEDRVMTVLGYTRESEIAIEEGKEWSKQLTDKIESLLVNEDDNVRVFVSDGQFCSASYYSPQMDKVIPSTATLNLKTNAVTIAFEDGGKKASAKEIVQELWGPEAGGRDGIAGSPRGQEMTLDDLYDVTTAIEEALKPKQYIQANGKEYEVVDGLRYMDKLEKRNAETVIAKKAGKIAIIEPEGDKIVTYTSNGNIETEEAVRPGYHVVAKANENGEPIVDEYGHMNMRQIEDTKLAKRYADVPENIEPGMSFAPAGNPQKFVQVDKDIAVMCPWGENGALVPQTIDKGGYLTSTSPTDCYGIAEAEFKETYKAIEEPKSVMVNKNMWEDIKNLAELERALNDAKGQFYAIASDIYSQDNSNGEMGTPQAIINATPEATEVPGIREAARRKWGADKARDEFEKQLKDKFGESYCAQVSVVAKFLTKEEQDRFDAYLASSKESIEDVFAPVYSKENQDETLIGFNLWKNVIVPLGNKNENERNIDTQTRQHEIKAAKDALNAVKSSIEDSKKHEGFTTSLGIKEQAAEMRDERNKSIGDGAR